MPLEIADVAIIGGGPAGAAAARLLSLWGRRAVLLTRGSSPRPLGESLPPSCTKLFDQLGVRGLVDGAGFIRATGNTVQWAGKDRVVESFEAGTFGYQVSRDAFDAVLLRGSEEAGATVVRDAVVIDVARYENSHWRVTGRGASGEFIVHAQWVLDCSGRAGVVARRDWRLPAASGRTLALAGIWDRADRWPVDDNTHTLVESFDGGWGWSVPVSTTRRYITVMLDPSITPIPTRAGLADAYLRELGRTRMLAEVTHGATMVDAPWGCDASAYSSERVADDRLLLVGDAGSFVDPLSSFGIKKALASAWLASVAVNTSLGDASMSSPAIDLFARRERAMFEHLQRESAALSRDAAGAHASSYWDSRGELQSVADESELDVTKLREDGRVLGAFDELRRRESIHLRPAASLGFTERAVVRGNRIRMERHIVSPALATPVRYCRGIDLVLMTELSGRHDQVPDLFNAYNQVAPPAPLPDFLGALSTLIGFGALTLA